MDHFQSFKHQVFSKSVCNILKQRLYIHNVRRRGARVDSAPPPPLENPIVFFCYMRDPFPAFSPCSGRFATFFLYVKFILIVRKITIKSTIIFTFSIQNIYGIQMYVQFYIFLYFSDNFIVSLMRSITGGGERDVLECSESVACLLSCLDFLCFRFHIRNKSWHISISSSSQSSLE